MTRAEWDSLWDGVLIFGYLNSKKTFVLRPGEDYVPCNGSAHQPNRVLWLIVRWLSHEICSAAAGWWWWWWRSGTEPCIGHKKKHNYALMHFYVHASSVSYLLLHVRSGTRPTVENNNNNKQARNKVDYSSWSSSSPSSPRPRWIPKTANLLKIVFSWAEYV